MNTLAKAAVRLGPTELGPGSANPGQGNVLKSEGERFGSWRAEALTWASGVFDRSHTPSVRWWVGTLTGDGPFTGAVNGP